jgi:hypothetical protein
MSLRITLLNIIPVVEISCLQSRLFPAVGHSPILAGIALLPPQVLEHDIEDTRK